MSEPLYVLPYLRPTYPTVFCSTPGCTRGSITPAINLLFVSVLKTCGSKSTVLRIGKPLSGKISFAIFYNYPKLVDDITAEASTRISLAVIAVTITMSSTVAPLTKISSLAL